jgi:hypothetical protein
LSGCSASGLSALDECDVRNELAVAGDEPLGAVQRVDRPEMGALDDRLRAGSHDLVGDRVLAENDLDSEDSP